MTRVSLSILAAVALAAGAFPPPVTAQVKAKPKANPDSAVAKSAESDTTEEESHEQPPPFAAGLTAGAMSFSGGRTQQGMAAILQYTATPWLTLSATPGFAQTTFAGTTQSGLTDIPLNAGVWRTMSDVTWSPTISGSLYATLSSSSSTSGLGLGQNTYGASAALSGWPTSDLNLTVGGSHPLGANSGNGSIELGSAYSLGKTTANLGFSSEVGSADSGAVLSQSVAGGLAFTVAGPLTLTVDGSHGLTSSAPSWTVSVGFGTVFAGLSPVNPTSPIRRLNRTFGSRASSPSGTKASCKRTGHC